MKGHANDVYINSCSTDNYKKIKKSGQLPID